MRLMFLSFLESAPACLPSLLRKWNYDEGDGGNGNEDDDDEPLFSCFRPSKAHLKNPEQRRVCVRAWVEVRL